MLSRIMTAATALLALVIALGSHAIPTAALTLNNIRAEMSMSTNAEGESILSLQVDRILFSAGGFAAGELANTVPPEPIYPPEPVFPPEPVIWLTDPFGGEAPADGEAAISFILNAEGKVSGIQPTPFRLFVSGPNGQDLNGFDGLLELDFSSVSGSLGSLNLSGVLLYELDDAGARTDVFYAVEPFKVEPVPLPAALPLLLSALGFFGFLGWRRKKAAAA